MTVTTDRLTGLSTSVAVKPPVKAVSSVALTLYGEQTVNLVAVVAGDRVLVKDQADPIDNGIYVVSDTAWARAADFDGNRDVVKGTLVVANSGSSIYYRVTTEDPIVIGEDDLEFDLISGAITAGSIGLVLYPRSDNEILAAVTPTAYEYQVGTVKRYGATGDGATDDSAAVQDAFDVAQVAGGEVYFPAGDYKIVTPLTIDGQLSADGANFSLKVHGAGRRISRLVSFVAAGDMLWIGNAAGEPQNGVSIRDLCFTADATSGEDSLLRCDYCLDARIENNLFDGGEEMQLFLGRAQNTLVLGNEFRGDATRTQYGIKTDEANGNAGQGAKFIRNTIRGMRTGDGIGLWLSSDGGGEHSVISNMIEGNVIGLLLEISRHYVFDNSFENSVTTDTQIKVGTVANLASRITITRNNFSASSHLDKKCLDLVNYSDIKIEGNKFFNDNGLHVYFGTEENNVPCLLIDNELPMASVSFGQTDGKVIVYGNSNNGTNNPRTTATAGDTTPSVANFDVLATANVGATSITDFDNGHPGKRLVVMIEDANTTIVDGTPIRTMTGANITPANGDVLLFEATVGSGATNEPVWRQLAFLPLADAVTAAAGTITWKSGNANSGNNTGMQELAPGRWFPYIADPTP